MNRLFVGSSGAAHSLTSMDLKAYLSSGKNHPLIYDIKGKASIGSAEAQHAVQHFCLSQWSQNKAGFIDGQKALFDWTFFHIKRRLLGSKSSPIQTVKQISEVMAAMDAYRFSEGKSVKPYEFITKEVCPNPAVKTILRFCFGDRSLSSKDLWKAIPKKFAFIAADPQLLKEACQGIKIALVKLGEQLKADGEIDSEVATLVIKNMLALLVFFSPQEGDHYELPLYLGGCWEIVSSKVERIKISSEDYPFTPYFAYGLVPHEKSWSKAPAHLLFMGTTYPAASGSLFTYAVDFHPFKSVGRDAFDEGRPSIEAYLIRMKAKGHPIHVVGQSLGGALSLHTAVEFPEQVDRVDAFSPPGLWQSDVLAFDDWVVDRRSTLVGDHEELPDIHIYRQKNDSVPQLGLAWPKTSHIHYIQGWDDQDLLAAHIRIEASGDHVKMVVGQESMRPSFRRSGLELLRRVFGVLPWLFIIVSKLFYRVARAIYGPFKKRVT